MHFLLSTSSTPGVFCAAPPRHSHKKPCSLQANGKPLEERIRDVAFTNHSSAPVSPTTSKSQKLRTDSAPCVFPPIAPVLNDPYGFEKEAQKLEREKEKYMRVSCTDFKPLVVPKQGALRCAMVFTC